MPEQFQLPGLSEALSRANGGDPAKEYFIQAAYLVASVLFILGLKGLTAPDKARHGMQLAAVGMLVGRDRHAAESRDRQLHVDHHRPGGRLGRSARRFRSGCR